VLDSNGRGFASVTLAALDSVVAKKKANPNKPMVINASLGGSRDDATNDAYDAAVDAGIFIVVAAGNEYRDAGNVSPASAEKVLTVAASNPNDWHGYRSKDGFRYSNYGPFVDLYAPGTDIVSAGIANDAASKMQDGTVGQRDLDELGDFG